MRANKIITTIIISIVLAAANAKPFVKLSKSGTYHNNIERIKKAAAKASIPETYDFGLYTNVAAILTSKDLRSNKPEHFTIQYKLEDGRQDIECWQNKDQLVISSITNGIDSSSKANESGCYGKSLKAFIYTVNKETNESQLLMYQSTSSTTKDGATLEVAYKTSDVIGDMYVINRLNSSYYWTFHNGFQSVMLHNRDYDEDVLASIDYSNTYLQPSLDTAMKMVIKNEQMIKATGYWSSDASIAEDHTPYID